MRSPPARPPAAQPPAWCFLRHPDRSCHVGSPGVTFRQTLSAFFNDKYMQENPEDLDKIDKLKELIAWQVR
ncbi:hypothetical protein CRUP_020543 [Coryphaenoides rupestris]|nr:hypothetical protein CRUP_020543 [Coryphaenoides rupestris]